MNPCECSVCTRDAEIAALKAAVESWKREEVIRDEREAIYREALEKVKTKGRVCLDYELCEHESCMDSSGAWMVADEALKRGEEVK